MRRFWWFLLMGAVFGLAAAPAWGQGENVPVSLEQAVRTVRANLSVPPECTVFNFGFEQGPMGSFWQLNWFSPKGFSNFGVTVDANTGEITSFHRFGAPGGPDGRLPRYTREEVQPVAVALVKKLAPQKWASLRLQPLQEQPWDLSRHTFVFVCYVNGIPFPENGVRVVIDGNSKEPVEYMLNWVPADDFPDPKGILSRDEALRRYWEQVKPHLEYLVPITPEDPERQRHPRLVYALEPGELAVDAFTGKVFAGMAPAFGPFGDLGMMTRRGGREPLTPAEQEEVESLADLITAAEAVKVVCGFVPQAARATLTQSSLTAGAPWQREKAWELHFDDSERRLRIDATVSATTGELLQLYISSTDSEELRGGVPAKKEEAKLSQEAAQGVAAAFLHRVAPALVGRVRLKEQQLSGFLNLHPVFNFQYQRVENDIPCAANFLAVQVDTVTGEVVGYQRQWVEAAFPPPAEAFSPGVALDRYLDSFGFELRYVRLVPSTPAEIFAGPADPYGWKKAKVYLVYALKLPSAGLFLDAQRGEFVDYEGNTVAVKPAPTFSDTTDSPFAKEIAMLKEAGVVTGYQGRFRPRDAVTQAELVAMLVAAQSPVAVPQAAEKTPWYSGAYEQAQLRGIIEAKEAAPARPVTRLELARLLVRGLGYRPVAELPALYRLPCRDAARVPATDRGYAALAWGLKLFPWSGSEFGPTAVVKREEAAAALVRFLRVPRPRVLM
ncbi:YcdB/YcdC domain-containing protein [Thermodesulfitimonas sp.]